MTKILGFVLIAMSVTPATSFADSLSTHRVFSTDALSLSLPKELEFHSKRIEVASSAWFNSLFENAGCESSMSKDLAGNFEVILTGDHQLQISWRGKKSLMFQKAYASYVPLHYRYGQAIPAHTLITIPGFVILHARITSVNGVRSLEVSLVRRNPARGLKLEPILTAHEL